MGFAGTVILRLTVGVLESGEDCDCGLPANCLDICCQASTCKLKAGAACSDGSDSCCSNCQLKSSGAVCHNSTGVCDTSLTCSGSSKICGTKSFLDDGTTCIYSAGVTAQCASGTCTSRDIQCKISGYGVTTVAACALFDFSCALSCQDAQGTCYSLSGNFVDGSSCSGSGTCVNGTCTGVTFSSIYP